MKTKLTKLLAVAVASLACASCNMVNGLGQDFQKMGKGVQSTAQGGLWRAPVAPAPTYQPTYRAPVYAPPR